MDKQQLAILAVAVGSIKAIKRGGSIPVPNAVLAENGLTYKSNSKHTLGMPGNRPDAGIEPRNSLIFFNNSITSGKKRYALDDNGSAISLHIQMMLLGIGLGEVGWINRLRSN